MLPMLCQSVLVSKQVNRMRVSKKSKPLLPSARVRKDSFTLTDSKTAQTRTLAYRDVAEVKGQGLSLSTKILIGVGIGIGVLVIIVAIGIANFDGFGDGPVIGGL
jgi:hypothetical protein